MSDADKLFKELEFKKIYDTEYGITYSKEGKDRIFRYIKFQKSACMIIVEYDEDESCYFGMQELKAINMKCKELRME